MLTRALQRVWLRRSSFSAMKTSGTWNMCIERRCQSCSLCQMEQEKARKDRRLKNFPKSLTHWRPEAGKMEPQCEKALTAISEGLQPTAILYSQYPSERKQHSHGCLYTSKQHPTKRPSNILWWRKTNLPWQRLELLNKSFSTLLHHRNSCGFLCYHMRGRSLIRSVVYGGHRSHCSRE